MCGIWNKREAIMSKFFEDDPRCASCAFSLTKEEIERAKTNNEPGACDMCHEFVIDEADNDFSMWPDDFFGHWYKTAEGIWTYSPIG